MARRNIDKTSKSGSEEHFHRILRDQRVAYILVGGLNTAVSFTLFVLIQISIGHLIGYIGVLLIAHVCSVLISFTMQRRFVFRVVGHFLLDLARFEVVNLVALGANIIVLPLLVEAATLPPIPAQLVATAGIVIGNYFAHRYFSFRRRVKRIR